MSNNEGSKWNEGALLRKTRMANGMSQDKVAEELGCARSTVASWESGHRKPKGASLKALTDWIKSQPEYADNFGKYLEDLVEVSD